jgi:hypothetical protein
VSFKSGIIDGDPAIGSPSGLAVARYGIGAMKCGCCGEKVLTIALGIDGEVPLPLLLTIPFDHLDTFIAKLQAERAAALGHIQ